MKLFKKIILLFALLGSSLSAYSKETEAKSTTQKNSVHDGQTYGGMGGN